MQIFRYPLRLAVVALMVGVTLTGVALACGPIQMVTRAGNVNSITNVGNGRSNTLIVEGTGSTFIQDEPSRIQPMPMPMQEPVPAVPAVPATPERVPVEPQPVQPVEPMPMQPVQPLQPVEQVKPVPEIVIRIPVPQQAIRGPVVQIPAIRMPNIEIPAMEVPAGRAIVTESAGGRTTIISSGNAQGNTTIISSNGKTTVFGGKGLCYTPRDGRFWSKSMYCQKLDCTVYYDPRTTLWFRYSDADATYRPVPALLDLDDE